MKHAVTLSSDDETELVMVSMIRSEQHIVTYLDRVIYHDNDKYCHIARSSSTQYVVLLHHSPSYGQTRFKHKILLEGLTSTRLRRYFTACHSQAWHQLSASSVTATATVASTYWHDEELSGVHDWRPNSLCLQQPPGAFFSYRCEYLCYKWRLDLFSICWQRNQSVAAGKTVAGDEFMWSDTPFKRRHPPSHPFICGLAPLPL